MVIESQESSQTNTGKPNSQSASPSRFLVNIFLLVGIGVLVFSGRIVKGTLAQYLVGSIAEIGLAILAVVCVKLNRLPIKQTMRLNWPGWESILLSLVAAPGLWMIGVVLNVITSLIMGYTTPTPPQMFPTNLWESLGFIFTAVIIAPICEELMFRGYVQRAYDRGKPFIGMVIGGCIFAAYHMQFQGLFALLPVAFALGYFAWRTESVIPGMVLHAAYNSIATVILITSTFLPYQIATVLLVSLILVGLLGIAGTTFSLWILWNKSRPKPLPKPGKTTRLIQWAWIIPLFLFALIYTYGSISEVIAGKFPQLLANEELEFEPQPAWRKQQSYKYDIQDIIGTQLGSAECVIDSYDAAYQLSCRGQHQTSSMLDNIPWDIPWLVQKFNITAADWERDVVWQEDNLQITMLHESQHILNRSMTIEPDSQTLMVEYDNGIISEFDLPANTLVIGEWPWRLTGLPLDLFYGGSIPLVTLNEEGNFELLDAFVSVRSAEPTWTAAGSVITWKVTLTYTDNMGHEITEAAWYDTVPPHPLIRYDDGQLNYVISTK